jgi:hypothetical protein
MALRPTDFNHDILPIDEARFFQTLAASCEVARLRQSAVDEQMSNMGFLPFGVGATDSDPPAGLGSPAADKLLHWPSHSVHALMCFGGSIACSHGAILATR